MTASISPPPSKRRKLVQTSGESVADLSTYRLRIFSHNVNGISPYLQPSIASFFKPNGNNEVPKASLRDFLRRQDWPTVLCLQEVKIHPEDRATIRAVEKAVSAPSDSVEPDYVSHVCLPSDAHNARGFGRKIYGVACIIRRDFFESHVEKLRLVDWDQEGRFLVVETKALGPVPRLAIFCVYAVNGTDFPYKDSTGRVTGTRHDRKLIVHELLAAECRALEHGGFSIVIAGDINIARSAFDGFPRLRTSPEQHSINRVDFEKKFFASTENLSLGDEDSTADQKGEPPTPGLGMIDSFRHLHPDKRGYTYYPRTKVFGASADRVDMIVVSRSLKDCLRAAGMLETAAERGPSDHVPLYVELEFREA
ncbi:hypothetical protein LTR78_008767 [Recurvomyces mirabilis]|uniref:Endonuclease/exonuclease/phosphatase domain-containing protein n=1 Tax=Recurvomyces mirabilis TaxID=574656 RepID=A0AAE0WGT6_9PEZI|nr:hypothetical protein LTR78_008767 [Recurvomyces mirabilis]KAK5160995.1 hypothetical protein LTS14_000789 [Recurvomyces mirabilis]